MGALKWRMGSQANLAKSGRRRGYGPRGRICLLPGYSHCRVLRSRSLSTQVISRFEKRSSLWTL